MNTEQLIQKTSELLNLKPQQVQVVLKLLDEGATVPFIARYRKEMTQNLNEDQIRDIYEEYQYQINLAKRKEAILSNLEVKGVLTQELVDLIQNTHKLVDLENIYKPYKDNKKTRASNAIALGLKPLAEWLLKNLKANDYLSEAKKYLNENVKTIDDAINGAKDIIAEIIANDLQIRSSLKQTITKFGWVISKLKPKAVDENQTFKVYYDFKNKLSYLSSYKVMALNRGEELKILQIKLDYSTDFSINQAENKYTKKIDSNVTKLIKEAITDGFKRLLIPSVENEVWNEITEKAHNESISRFAHNLEQLLLQSPIRDKNVLGWDPGFRTGCKLAVILKNNDVKAIDVVYPFETNNNKAKQLVSDLVNKYNIDIIAIGNGTASRESEEFVSNLIKEFKLNCEYAIVSEAGASVYSASKLAQAEFPELTVEKRSAISIGRRIIDPLAELIKVPTMSIGVGQYQHDLPEKKLIEKLDFVVEKVVNKVGVDVNTASVVLLSHISGLTNSIANAIVEYRLKNGDFKNRSELLKVKGLSEKKFEQASGFLRIIGNEPLDKTNIHPESYQIAYQVLAMFNLSVNDIGTKKAIDTFKNVNIAKISQELNSDTYTIQDIISSLTSELRDYRDQFEQPMLRKDILNFENLYEGLHLQGVVRNIVDFGAFVDLGIKETALLHLSQMTNNKNQTPYDLVNINQIVNVEIISIDKTTKRIGLKLI